MTDIALRILLQAQNQMSGVVSSAVRDLMGINPILGGVAVAGLAVGAAVVGIGVKTTQMAGQFQNAMLQNEAHAGLAANQVQRVNDALMQMGPAVGQGPTQLADAMYPILSGFSNITDQSAKTSVSLEELKLASESVAGSTARVYDASKAATSAFNAYNLESNNTGKNLKNLHMLFDVMNQTVSEGNMKWSDYSRMVGNFLAKSAQAGTKIQEANAALAVFTNSGESAQLAGTHLGALFLYLGTQSAKMADNAKKLHLEFDAQKFASMDLAEKMAYLKDVTGGNFAEIQKLMGGNKTLASTFQKLSDHAKDYKNALSDLNKASVGKGATQTAFDIVKTGDVFKGQQNSAALQALGITIGEKLLPYVSALKTQILALVVGFTSWLVKSGALATIINGVAGGVHFLVGAITTLVTVGAGIVSFFQHNQAAMDALLALLATVALQILSLVVPAFISWGVAAISAAIGTLAAMWPILAAGALVAAVIFGIIEVIQHWGTIVGWLKDVWSAVAGFFVGLWDSIADIFRQAWSVIVAIFTPIITVFKDIFMVMLYIVIGVINLIILPWRLLIMLMMGLFERLLPFFRRVWNGITGVFHAVATWFGGIFQAAWHAITAAWSVVVGWFGGLWDGIVGVFSPVVSWFSTQFTNAANAVKQVFGVIAGWFHTLWNGVVADFKSIFGGLGSIFQNIWTHVTDVFKGGVNWFIDRINWLIDRYNSLPKFGAPNISHIAHLATGGVINQGGLFSVGEEGPETVLLPGGATVFPSGAFNGSGGGGTRVFVTNVYAGLMTDRRQADQLATIIGQRLAQQWRSQANIQTATSGSVRS